MGGEDRNRTPAELTADSGSGFSRTGTRRKRGAGKTDAGGRGSSGSRPQSIVSAVRWRWPVYATLAFGGFAVVANSVASALRRLDSTTTPDTVRLLGHVGSSPTEMAVTAHQVSLIATGVGSLLLGWLLLGALLRSTA